MNAASALLSVEGLAFSYGKRPVLDSVDFCLERGESLLLLGQNGAGKTTLLACVLGMLRPKKGRVAWGLERVELGGFLGEPPLAMELSGWDQIALSLELRPWGRELLRKKAWRPEVEGNAELLGMPIAELSKKARQCSTGNRKKLAILMALMARPELLILDEPASGLDPAGIVDLREALARLRAEKSLSLIVSSHQIAESRKGADRALILHKGRIAESIDLKAEAEGLWEAGFARDLGAEAEAIKAMGCFEADLAIESPRLVRGRPKGPPEAVLKRLAALEAGLERFCPAPDDLERRYLALLEDEAASEEALRADGGKAQRKGRAGA
jgi:ABC-type multidrug transport system ATPase subunit